MRRNKFRVGKNDRGWFVAIPQGWGGYNVIEAFDTHEQAMAAYNHFRSYWSDVLEWL